MVKKIDSAQVWTSKFTGRSSNWSSDAKIIEILVCNKYYAYHKELHTPNQKRRKRKKEPQWLVKPNIYKYITRFIPKHASAKLFMHSFDES